MENITKILKVIALLAIIGAIFIACHEPDSDSALTGTVSINGIAEVGRTLTVNTADLNGSGTISYRWKRGGSDISSAYNSTYIVQSTDVNNRISVTVTRSGYSGRITSEPTISVTDPIRPALSGMVVIGGTAQVGQTLTADTSRLGGGGTIFYQWMRDGVYINGADSSTYTVQNTDIGSVITISVIRSGASGSITSEPTIHVTNSSLPALGGTVIIGGTAQVGQTLTADTSALSGSGTISYQWKQGGRTVIGSNSPTCEVVTAGYAITVTVTSSANSGSITSNPTAIVTDNPSLPALTGTVSIKGSAQTGQTLTADTSALNGDGTIFYRWMRDGIDIGINSSTYFVQSTDVGSTISVMVTRIGYSRSITSELTDVIVISENTEGLLFRLTINKRSYSVSKGSATATEVVIPSVYDGLLVTEISDNGFENYTNMSSIIIPDSVTRIGFNAFSNTGIWNNTPDNSVVYADKWVVGYKGAIGDLVIKTDTMGIGGRAFLNCSSLTSITIPNSVTSIGYGAFWDCSSLTSITILDNVTSISISDFAFYGCSGLENIIVNSGNMVYRGEGNCLIMKSNNLLILGCKNSVIPYSVTSIGDLAFISCTGLTSITIPNSVTSIGNGAFWDCSSLTSVTIPDSVTSIGDTAFNGCTSLTSVTIGNSVTSIGWMTFAYCTSLTSITIPNSVTSIGNNAFNGCTSLTSVTIPNSMTSIGQQTFFGCSSLTSVTIPNSMTSIGQQTFEGCSGLTSITIPNSVTSIGDNAFNGCTSLASITIPNSVTSIGNGAFWDCSSLTSITIPNSVTRIGSYAFSGCTSLTSITIPNSVTSIGSSAFSGCYSLTSITIPNSVTSIGSGAFAACTGLTSITIGTITSANFSSYYPFPGNLRDVYFSVGGGAGTYVTINPGDSAVWVKK